MALLLAVGGFRVSALRQFLLVIGATEIIKIETEIEERDRNVPQHSSTLSSF